MAILMGIMAVSRLRINGAQAALFDEDRGIEYRVQGIGDGEADAMYCGGFEQDVGSKADGGAIVFDSPVPIEFIRSLEEVRAIDKPWFFCDCIDGNDITAIRCERNDRAIHPYEEPIVVFTDVDIVFLGTELYFKLELTMSAE